MDIVDFTTSELQKTDLEEILWLLEEGMTDICEISFFESRPLAVELPATVSRKVLHTEYISGTPASTATTKTATLLSGAEIEVPSFVEAGEYIDIDTRKRSCLGRSK